jgi:hypothetical protein
MFVVSSSVAWQAFHYSQIKNTGFTSVAVVTITAGAELQQVFATHRDGCIRLLKIGIVNGN